MSFGFRIAAGPLLSGFLVGSGFPAPFVVGATLAAVDVILVSTQVEEVATPTGEF